MALPLTSAATFWLAAERLAEAPALTLWRSVAPDTLAPETIRLRLDAMLARTVDADWLAARTEAALIEPVDFARLEALDALAEERGLALPPALAERRAAAEAARPSWLRSCVGGVVSGELPDDPAAISCYFASALTSIGDGRDLVGEGAKWAAGEPADALTVALAGAGIGALALGPGAPIAKGAVASLKTARRLGALSPRLAADLGRRGAEAVRFAPDRPWRQAVDLGAARRLAGDLAEFGRVGARLGPVDGVRALRHVESLGDAPKLRRVAEAMGPRTTRTLDALGGRRAFSVFLRLNRAVVAAAALAAALLAQLGLLVVAATQASGGRVLAKALRRAL